MGSLSETSRARARERADRRARHIRHAGLIVDHGNGKRRESRVECTPCWPVWAPETGERQEGTRIGEARNLTMQQLLSVPAESRDAAGVFIPVGGSDPDYLITAKLLASIAYSPRRRIMAASMRRCAR
jgi:hypothetical protein